ncbi:MAG: hypothetical protein J0I10_20005 [Verrucomicrobia bacterium]|nr:hypothetical protein [Verrucomicrobiota bacterium]
MKTLLLAASLTCFAALPLQAQVNAAVRDTALRSFLGIRSVGSSAPIADTTVSGFATVLVFKDGKFWKRLADAPLLPNLGQTPIALGNAKAGYAPATAQVEFLWGPRDGKVGYLFQARIGDGGLVPKFHEMPELAALNTLYSDAYRGPNPPQFHGMSVMGAAYTLNKPPQGEDIEACIKAADLAVVVLFKTFESRDDAVAFGKAWEQQFPK